MTIRYQDRANYSALSKPKHKFVQAWALFDYPNNKECVFFIDEKGNCFTKGWAIFSHAFNAPNFVWYSTPQIPAHAEYIGNYEYPHNIV